ncbi:hypothetical protein BGZ83_009392 [Gryganskiella cystojenkinii]|nr:hypothetical protein BGZ83_009392 [Gryganskiella cystojenkinii]
MASFDFNHHSHRRFNPLTNSWVLCSPHRTQRPWQGKEEEDDAGNTRPSYDPSCYLCPGNTRATAGATRNPEYEDTFVFENDFPAVQQDQPQLDTSSNESNPLFQVESVRGKCHVICFSPDHSKTLADMTELEILPVIQAWISTYESLRKTEFINHVQIFENKGAIMGCSNPHPHGQVWSTEDIPQETAQELRSMATYKKKHHRCMLCDYVKSETKLSSVSLNGSAHLNGSVNGSAHTNGVSGSVNGSVYTNGHPAHTNGPSTSASAKLEGSRVVCENDSFVCVVPFWATWPFETLVLFELLGQAQRDLTPEQAAKRLADCSEVHYKTIKKNQVSV